MTHDWSCQVLAVIYVEFSHSLGRKQTLRLSLNGCFLTAALEEKVDVRRPLTQLISVARKLA